MTNPFLSLFTAAVLLITAAGAFAQNRERPEIGPAPNFELPTTTNIVLANGLQVTFIDFGLAPKVSISVQVLAGNAFDDEQTYLADVVAAMMEEGAAGQSREEIARRFATMGGNMNVAVGLHASRFSADVLSEYGPDAITELAAVIRSPDLPEAAFDRVLQSQIRNVSIARSQPGPIATEAYLGLLYGTAHPYGQSIPDDGQMEQFTLEDVRTFYEENYGASRTRIYVAGRFDEAEMETAIRNAFGDWAPGEVANITSPAPRSGPLVRLIDRPGANQTTIRMGAPIPEIGTDAAFDLAVMNALLGGSFISRLAVNLREANGWSYTPRSVITHWVGASFWTFTADITTEHTIEAFAEIFGEIQDLQIELPSEDEAQGVRNWLSGVFILENASTDELIDQLAIQDLFGLPDDYLETYVERISAVSRVDISNAASEYLQPDQMFFVIVGDLDLIEEPLRAFPQLADAEFISDRDWQ